MGARLPAVFGRGRWGRPRPDEERNGLPLWGNRPFLFIVLAAAPWFWWGQAALVWGFLRATGFAEGGALLWHGIFCCPLLLSGNVLLW